MARVSLSLAHRPGVRGVPYYRPEDRSGTVYYIPRPWLMIRLFVLPRGSLDPHRPDDLPEDWQPEVLLDTGAPLSVFPFGVWEPFGDAIQWLDQPPGARQLTILGGTFTYRLGLLRFGVFDFGGNWLPAATSNAWFLEDDPAAPKQAILGLRTRLFDQRQLRCADVPEDVFGQVWALEDS